MTIVTMEILIYNFYEIENTKKLLILWPDTRTRERVLWKQYKWQKLDQVYSITSGKEKKITFKLCIYVPDNLLYSSQCIECVVTCITTTIHWKRWLIHAHIDYVVHSVYADG